MSEFMETVSRLAVALQKLCIKPNVTVEMSSFEDWSILEHHLSKEFSGMLRSQSSDQKPSVSIKFNGMTFIPPNGEKQAISRDRFAELIAETPD